MEDRFGHRISYLRVSVTDRCNERCRYCMPEEMQEWLPRADVLSFEEIQRLILIAAGLGVDKVRLTGGEPLTRPGLVQFVSQLSALGCLKQIGLSTNGSLLTRTGPGGKSLAAQLREAGVTSLNISLDTLDPGTYAQVTGRDFLPRVLAGIDAGVAAGFDHIRINAVLMRGRNENSLLEMVEFAHARSLLLRFIELMPVSTTEVLNDKNFFPVREARRVLENSLGQLIPQPDFRTNGPATYYQIPGREQKIGFIGALTNLHFCETCNKLRLTCDGKLRPCLGSHLEVDLMGALRGGADDQALRAIFLDTIARKPEKHEFRENYQPGRRMIAIGG
ncbi:MAG: GTP 3',8-cyclase MoaA [Verrucomicrobiota bacterium]